MMDDQREERQEVAAGLCGDCTYARRVTSDRGAHFLRCARAAADARFAKYPRLPVLSCPGFEPAREPGVR